MKTYEIAYIVTGVILVISTITVIASLILCIWLDTVFWLKVLGTHIIVLLASYLFNESAKQLMEKEGK